MNIHNTRVFNGIRIIEDSFVQEFTYKTVKRTWKERLFTRPFKPFQKFKQIEDKRLILRCDLGIVCHPSTAMAIMSNIT